MSVSWQARAFILGMRLIGLKQRLFGSARAIDATVRRDRKNGPARPSARMRRRFVVSESVVVVGDVGRAVTVVAPRGAPPARRILYLHGGGFVMSMTPLHWLLVSRLCHRLQATVVVPDYPLAPEHGCLEVNAWVVGHYEQLVRSVDTATLSVMGDSAGGHLALALLLQARDRGLPLPSSAVLLSPAVAGDYHHPQRQAQDKTDCMIALSGMESLARLYAKDLDVEDPRIALLRGSLAGLPPLAVFAGGDEIMLFDALRMQEKAKEEGADVAVSLYDEMFHVWPIFPIPEARRAVAALVDFVRQQELHRRPAEAQAA